MPTTQQHSPHHYHHHITTHYTSSFHRIKPTNRQRIVVEMSQKESGLDMG